MRPPRSPTPLLRLLLLLCFRLHHATSQPASNSNKNYLGRGSSLSVGHFLTSPDRTFSCGFSAVGDNAYTFSIWFANSTNGTVAWSANRDRPVNGQGSSFSFLKSGNLVLTDVDGTVVWTAGLESPGGARAELLDAGNLVVKNGTGNVLWQSFDSPTDTLLPSQPLTKGKKLTSAITNGTQVSGYYNLLFDNDNVLRLMYDGPEISSLYWPLGVFESGRTKYNSSRRAVLDDAGRFVSSDNLDVSSSDFGLGIKRRMTLDYDGNLRIYSLNDSTGLWSFKWEAISQICDVHGLCGRNGICSYYKPKLGCTCPPGYEMSDPTDWNKGCKPLFNITCNKTSVRFEKLHETDFYGFDLSSYGAAVSFESCKNRCLSDCSCLGFGYRLTGEGACYPKGSLFNGFTSPDFPGSTYLKLPSDLRTSSNISSTDISCNDVRVDSPERTASSNQKSKVGQLLVYFYSFAGALGAVEAVFIAVGWWFLYRNSVEPNSVLEGYALITSQFKKFTYKELQEVTGRFRETLGRGSSGSVYKGVLINDKRVVAVKKLEDVVQGEEEFWAEMSFIGKINHMNLVRMWGFCSEGSHRLLVYEYMENGSLDKHIFFHGSEGDQMQMPLDWKQRFNIALGTAKGLQYLHHECLEWVIHCDVKPENILLDHNFEAKIGDFGLAKLSQRSNSDIGVSKVRGTMGYMAPEWVLNLPITAKVDVYSFGVVLLELITGARVSNWGGSDKGGETDLRGLVGNVRRNLVDEGDSWVKDLVDPKLKGEYNLKQALRMLEVAVLCVDDESNKRPTMDAVVEVLQSGSCQDD